MLSRGVLLKLADSPSVGRLVKRQGMRVARRFVAGETIEETIEPIRALNARGITATLDYLGENVTRTAEADESTAYYHRLIDFIDANRLDSNVSLKLTQLGLDLSEELAYSNLCSILEKADRYNQFVRVDMEGSAYTERTLSIFYRLRPDHSNVGVVIQSYLRRSEKDVEKLFDLGARVRLVKGAYNEPAEVAFQDKSDVDRNFLDLMNKLLRDGNYPAIATHDEAIIRSTIQFASDESIPPSKYEFQMLYGIRRERQQSLVNEGFRMRVYVPFGTQWYAYMMRRLAERPANLWFVLKNLFVK